MENIYNDNHHHHYHRDSTYRNLNHSNSTNNSYVIINVDLLIKILLILSIFFSVCIILVIICHVSENPYSNLCCICYRFKRKKGIEVELGKMSHNLVKEVKEYKEDKE